MKKVLVFSLLLLTFGLSAQCPMCKMAAESNLKNGGSSGLGLNGGIIYLFTLPYLAVAVIAYFWYKNRIKSADDVFADEEEQARWN
jgi:hypothetical protein